MEDSKTIKEGVPENASIFIVKVSTNFQDYSRSDYSSQEEAVNDYYRKSRINSFFEKTFTRIVEGNYVPFSNMYEYMTGTVNEGIVFYVAVCESREEVEKALKDIEKYEEVIASSFTLYDGEPIRTIKEIQPSEEVLAMVDA